MNGLNLKKDYALTETETAGKWFPVPDRATGQPLPGVRIRVASALNEDYTRDLNKRLGDLAPRQVRRGKIKMNMEANREASIQAAARHLLLDWEGIVGDDGQPVPCTLENRLEALRLGPFFDHVADCAESTQEFLEAEEKN